MLNTGADGYPLSCGDFSAMTEFYREYFERELEKACGNFAEEGCGYEELAEAMKYSLQAGGKRIRPMLALEFCRVCGGNIKDVLPAAIAIEMIHTFSLIHDDLPCMDDDDMRRGRPSCHIAYGEALAMLAGDALAFEACRVVANSDLDAKKAKMTISTLCNYSKKMIGGQTIDLKGADERTLIDMYALKTSMLISAACESGCIAAGADDEKISAAREYAYYLGAAFQITDDILDVTADETELGKPTGSDEKSDKFTSVKLYGLDNARVKAKEYTDKALLALTKFDDRDLLEKLTDMLLRRKK